MANRVPPGEALDQEPRAPALGAAKLHALRRASAVLAVDNAVRVDHERHAVASDERDRSRNAELLAEFAVRRKESSWFKLPGENRLQHHLRDLVRQARLSRDAPKQRRRRDSAPRSRGQKASAVSVLQHAKPTRQQEFAAAAVSRNYRLLAATGQARGSRASISRTHSS